MKILLVLSFFVVVALANKLTALEEDDAIRYYTTLCANQLQEGLSNGDTFVHCKVPIEASPETFREHEIRADGDGTTTKQIVFFRPQSNIYNHQLTLTGTSENSQDTTIYVLPNNDQHEVSVKDRRVTRTKGEKPRLHYITRDPHAKEFSRLPISSLIRDDRDFLRPISSLRNFDDRDFRSPFSRSSLRDFDERDFRPAFSRSPLRSFDDRDFRPAFSRSPLRSFDDRDFRPAFSRSPLIASSSDDTRVTFTK